MCAWLIFLPNADLRSSSDNSEWQIFRVARISCTFFQTVESWVTRGLISGNCREISNKQEYDSLQMLHVTGFLRIFYHWKPDWNQLGLTQVINFPDWKPLSIYARNDRLSGSKTAAVFSQGPWLAPPQNITWAMISIICTEKSALIRLNRFISIRENTKRAWLVDFLHQKSYTGFSQKRSRGHAMSEL